MTLERASEIINTIMNESNCPNQVAYDLFSHFLDFFYISKDDEYTIKMFARMCGFAMIASAQILEKRV